MDRTLDYLEIAVTEECNLNCKACSHFSPLANKEDRVILEEFIHDVKRMHELFPNIITIRLLGGEPLLNTEVFEMARYMRSLYSKSRITIVTNGLLIPKIGKKNLTQMVEQGIEFDISLYKPTLKIRPDIERICNEFGIKFRFSEMINSFRIRFDPSGKNNGTVSYKECAIGKTCTYLYKGKLSGCPAPNVVHLFDRSFETKYSCEDDMVNIHNTQLSAEEIYNKINSEMKFCRYCTTIREIPWEKCSGTPSAKDWFVN